MLALTRREGQTLLIGEEIEITVVQVKGKSVRLAIQAPARVKILRKEVLEEIKKENIAAALEKGVFKKQ